MSFSSPEYCSQGNKNLLRLLRLRNDNTECIHSYFVCDAQCITTYNREFSNLFLFQVYTRVPEGDFIRVTGDSQRVYLKVKPFIEKVTADNISHSFLAQPFQYLKSQVCSSYYTTG